MNFLVQEHVQLTVKASTYILYILCPTFFNKFSGDAHAANSHAANLTIVNSYCHSQAAHSPTAIANYSRY